MIDTSKFRLLCLVAGLWILAQPAFSATDIPPMGGGSVVPPLPNADELYYSEPENILPSPTMTIQRPPLQALISVDKHLNPFQMEAETFRTMGLDEVLRTGIDNNLDLQISNLDLKNAKWKLLNAYSKFLPDGRLAFNRYQARGHVRLPVGIGGTTGPIRIDSPFIITSAGVNYKLFQGGRVLYGALQSRNTFRATRHRTHATLNDTLLECTRRYYNLLLNEALLQIRIRAVETSVAQLQNNKDREQNGFATHLDVLQAETQLSADRQALIEQQIARRNSAIQLAEYLNIDTGVDIEPGDSTIFPCRLISDDTVAKQLLQIAMNNRPELKDYRERWLAARKAVTVAAAPALPTVQIGATEYGIGETLTNKKRTTVSAATAALSPITLGSSAAGASVQTRSRQITGLGTLSMQINWDIHGLGMADLTNTMAAKVQARQALLESNKEVTAVTSQVRQSYLNQVSAFNRISETKSRITSSAEELRLSQLRLQAGLGKNIDVLKAQQDYTTGLVEHARAIIDFNIAQAQLLHDLGIISRESLIKPI